MCPLIFVEGLQVWKGIRHITTAKEDPKMESLFSEDGSQKANIYDVNNIAILRIYVTIKNSTLELSVLSHSL